MQTETEFIEVTNAGMMESHVHDVMITKRSSKLPKKLAYKKINFDKKDYCKKPSLEEIALSCPEKIFIIT